MGLDNLTEVNGACSTVWDRLCSVASYKRLSKCHRREKDGDGICGCGVVENTTKSTFHFGFWSDKAFVSLPLSLSTRSAFQVSEYYQVLCQRC